MFNNFELTRDNSRALIFLSPGGSDADVMREFDMQKKEFIENGFTLPEAKGSAHWVDNNTLRVDRTHGENSETDGGYARTIREWKRGEHFESAKVIYEINKSEYLTYSKDVRTSAQTCFFLGRGIDFYHIEEMVFQNGEWRKLNLPTMAEDFKIVENKYIVMIKEDWNQFKIGDVIAYDLGTHECKKIFSVNKNESIYSISRSRSGLYAIVDEDVKGTLYKFTLDKTGNWSKVKIDLPVNGSVGNLSTDYQSDKFFVSYSSFNKPATYYYGEGEKIICAARRLLPFIIMKTLSLNKVFQPV